MPPLHAAVIFRISRIFRALDYLTSEDNSSGQTLCFPPLSQRVLCGSNLQPNPSIKFIALPLGSLFDPRLALLHILQLFIRWIP